ncbi:outer membrane protein [Thalassovita sp.]|uniref:outer membrane protein n=1 Tax=Thalassovita sp. TaxID=1979401 RepID=UPI0029DE6685|nr:outer membrane beta-barrel protein [Thalassovita sp.]
MFRTLTLALTAVAALAGPALAEIEIDLYLGGEQPGGSNVSGTAVPVGAVDADIDWDGKSDVMPPYYGARAVYWMPSNIGWGLEFSHNKVYAPDAQMTAAGFDRMELTDGHNLITLNVMKRWPGQWGSLTPFVGAGLGVALPHVDIEPTGGAHTLGYQMTGPALRLLAGVRYQITDHWSVFGEYQFTWSDNEIDLDGGGSLSTTITSNAVNIGVGFAF